MLFVWLSGSPLHVVSSEVDKKMALYCRPISKRNIMGSGYNYMINHSMLTLNIIRWKNFNVLHPLGLLFHITSK